MTKMTRMSTSALLAAFDRQVWIKNKQSNRGPQRLLSHTPVWPLLTWKYYCFACHAQHRMLHFPCHGARIILKCVCTHPSAHQDDLSGLSFFLQPDLGASKRPSPLASPKKKCEPPCVQWEIQSAEMKQVHDIRTSNITHAGGYVQYYGECLTFLLPGKLGPEKEQKKNMGKKWGKKKNIGNGRRKKRALPCLILFVDENCIESPWSFLTLKFCSGFQRFPHLVQDTPSIPPPRAGEDHPSSAQALPRRDILGTFTFSVPPSALPAQRLGLRVYWYNSSSRRSFRKVSSSQGRKWAYCFKRSSSQGRETALSARQAICNMS